MTVTATDDSINEKVDVTIAGGSAVVAIGSASSIEKVLNPGDTLTYGDFIPLFIDGGMINSGDGGTLWLPRNGAYVITCQVHLFVSGASDTGTVRFSIQAGSQNITGANYPSERFIMSGDPDVALSEMRIVRTATLLTTSVDPDGNVAVYPEIEWENGGQVATLTVQVANYQVIELPGAHLEDGVFP